MSEEHEQKHVISQAEYERETEDLYKHLRHICGFSPSEALVVLVKVTAKILCEQAHDATSLFEATQLFCISLMKRVYPL